MSGKYLLLYEYLENRYANTVVLTFAEIEDLLGFTLPDLAGSRQEWWTDGKVNITGPHYSDSWILASRTATPNLVARTVVFERASVRPSVLASALSTSAVMADGTHDAPDSCLNWRALPAAREDTCCRGLRFCYRARD